MIMSRPLEVLLVEDNPGDVDLVCAALGRCPVNTSVSIARDGVAALAVLRSKLISPPLPDIILLDLNLPKKNGQDVLKEIKQDRTLRRIPVIVLTSSSAPDDIAMAYDHGTNCYLSKSIDFATSKRVLELISDFWFQTAQLPFVKS